MAARVVAAAKTAVLDSAGKSAQVLASLQQHVSAGFTGTVSQSPSVLERHGMDESWHPPQLPHAVLSARTLNDVQTVLRTCKEWDCPVIPYGAGTSLEGHLHALRGGLSLDVSEMNNILSVDPLEMTATVQCGVLRSQLDSYLRDTGLFFPVDPGADATLGGMISTSASGTTTVRYGRMRDNVVGLKVVLPDGSVLETGKERKGCSNAVDLTSMFVGAEGTLGVVTEATLKLFPRPEYVRAAVSPFKSTEDVVRTSVAVLREGIQIARIELVDAESVEAVNRFSNSSHVTSPSLFVECQGTSTSTEADMERVRQIAHENGALDFKTASGADQQKHLWHARHNAYYAILALKPGSKGMICDACVPISRLAECILETQADVANTSLQAPIIGHIGDGNFHLILLVDLENREEIMTAKGISDRLSQRAISMGGTCTGEHGVGFGKIPYLEAEYDKNALELMRSMKRVLDPTSIMNPGKIVRM